MRPPTTELGTDTLATPIGTIRWTETKSGICGLGFCDGWDRVQTQLARRFQTFRVTEITSTHRPTLGSYFAGDLRALDPLPVDVAGTEFQQRVWGALREIPVGSTVSYRQLAGIINRNEAVRAVGAANGANPVALVVPCHRAIGANGSLTGYAFGIERKRWLLAHEQVAGQTALL